MAKIHPLILVIVGLLIAGVSAYGTYGLGQKFLLFMLLGLMMFGYGFVRMLIFGKKNEPMIKTAEKPQGKPNIYASCPYCQATIPSNSIFCAFCGRRLR